MIRINGKIPCPICSMVDYRSLVRHFGDEHGEDLREWLTRYPPECEACGGPIRYPARGLLRGQDLGS